MVLPIVSNASLLENVTEGTIVYDLVDHCVKVFTISDSKTAFTKADLQWSCMSADTKAVKLP